MNELPNGWVEGTINDTGDYINGMAFKPSDWSSGGLPIIRIQNLTDPQKTLNKTTRTIEPRYFVDNGDILVSWSATLDAFIWERGRAVLNQHIFKVLPRAQLVDKGFLYHGLRKTIREMIASEHLHGSTMRHVNRGPFLAHPFPLPPLPEQRRIVAKIDSLFAKSKRARDHLHHIPRLVEMYKQAILTAAFRGDLTDEWRQHTHHYSTAKQLEAVRKSGWQQLRDRGRAAARYTPAEGIYWRPDIDIPSGWIWASVDQITCLIQYGSSAKTVEEDQGRVPVLRMGNIKDGHLDLNSLKFLPEDHDEFPELLLERGDVLFNRTNSAELVGKSAIYLGEPAEASFASYLIRLRCTGLLPELLSGYINSAYGREWIATVVSQQVGQANVNGTKLRQLGVPVMPREEQAEIAHRIRTAFEWIDRLAHEANNARKLIGHLDQAVLAKAFRGELVQQDPSDEPASVLLERIQAERQEATTALRRVKKQTKAPRTRRRVSRRR